MSGASRGPRRAVWPALAAALLLAATAAARAQSTSSSLVGEVRTGEGAPLPGAVVQARSDETGALRTAVSDERGSYRIDLLRPGVWVVAARLPNGGLSATRTVELRLQQTVRLDFTVGTGLAERVTVVAQTPLVDRRQTAGTLRVSSGQAESLPLAGRVFTDLALLESSVREAAPGNYFGERASVFTVNGQGGRSNTFLVDGLDNNDLTSGTTLNSFFSQQVIREFVLSTHQYAPEFGRASGGVLNIVTRQGGNERTWQAFFQGSANRWNSPGGFVDALSSGAERLEALRRWQAGFALGGPFRKDAAFYFLAYEHQRSDAVIPYTGVGRDGIAGGRFRAAATDDNLFLRTDFNLTPSHTLMVRLSADDRSTDGINVGGTFTPEYGFRIEEQDLQLAASLTSILAPQRISETRLLIGTSRFDQTANSDRPGVTRPSGVFGGNELNRQARGEDKLQLVQNLTLRRRDHTLKFGLDLTRSRTRIRTRFHPNGNFLYNSDRPFEPGDCGEGASSLEAQNTLDDGTVIDTNGNPVCIGVPDVDDDGDGLVDEPTNLFSYPVVYSLIDGEPAAILEDTTVGLFAQDRWEVGPRLLLDYGLRYDLSSYTLPDGARVASSVPNGGAARDTDNLAPRFGFTYTPAADGTTVLRGGAGVFYDKLVLGFPAVAAITSGTQIGLLFPQGFAFELTEATVEELGIDELRPLLVFPDELVLRFSTATELDTPYTVQLNLGVDRVVGHNGAVRANFVRALGYHVPLMRDLNPVIGLIPPGFDCPADVDPGLTVGFPCHGPDPATGSIAAITTGGRSWYWGVDLGYRLQTADGWFATSYTLSRAEDLGFDPLKGGIALPPDSSDLAGERGRADGDRRHRLVVAGETGLPWLGLRLSGVLQLASGLPFNVTTGQDDNLDGILTDRPDGVRRNSGESTPLAPLRELRAEYDRTLPPGQRLPPIGSLREPSFAQVDVRLFRSFSFDAGRTSAEFFLQVFNLLDRENGGLVEGRVISRRFGEVITLAGPPRTVEVGIKFGR